MCGIVGHKNFNSNSASFKEMVGSLAHRGPDAQGYFEDFDLKIALGHRRLSILDLSKNSNQPFYSRCGRYIMVYNGEIYNFKELALELKLASGYVPSTSSDTEIILEAYAEFGESVIKRLKGMFAIAIWDRKEKNLNLFRDHIGVKPLYYYFKNGQLCFGSEIKSILAFLGKTHLSIDLESISDLLIYGYTVGTNTIYKEIKKIPAGGKLELNRDDKLSILPYWTISEQVKPDTLKDYASVKSELKNKLIDSVQRNMISDVPIGTFLSGGIDSSLVTSIAQSLSDRPINTFTIGFNENEFNEAKHANEIAKKLKTNHHEFILSEKDAIDQIEKLLNIYDEPFSDSSSIPTLLVSEMAKKHVTVTLSGDGGDELFHGYGMYNWAQRLDNRLIYQLRKPIASLLNLTNKSRNQRAAKVFNAPSKRFLKSHIFSQEQYLFSLSEVNQIMVESPKNRFLQESWSYNRKLTPMEEQAIFDLNYYLPDDLLVKVDRASMNHSLEVRVPLLDYEIISYSLNIDQGLKFRNGFGKYILKEVLFDFLPPDIFDRPKSGFSIPLIRWLKGDLKYLIDNYLSKESVEIVGIMKYDIIEDLKKQYFKGKYFLYNRLWILIQIHKFLLNV